MQNLFFDINNSVNLISKKYPDHKHKPIKQSGQKPVMCGYETPQKYGEPCC